MELALFESDAHVELVADNVGVEFGDTGLDDLGAEKFDG